MPGTPIREDFYGSGSECSVVYGPTLNGFSMATCPYVWQVQLPAKSWLISSRPPGCWRTWRRWALTSRPPHLSPFTPWSWSLPPRVLRFPSSGCCAGTVDLFVCNCNFLNCVSITSWTPSITILLHYVFFYFFPSGVATANHLPPSHCTLFSSSLTPTNFMSSFTTFINLLFGLPLDFLPGDSNDILLFTCPNHPSLAYLALSAQTSDMRCPSDVLIPENLNILICYLQL